MYIHLVSDAASGKIGVGEENKFEWCNGAFDRHLRDVDDELSPLPALEKLRQRAGSVYRVEIEDLFVPEISLQPFRLFGTDDCAGGHHEKVVREDGGIGKQDAALFGLYPVNHGGYDINTRREEVRIWLHDIPALVDPERDKEKPRLIEMRLLLIDDRNLPFPALEDVTEPVHHHGAGGACTEDHELLHETVSLFEMAGRISSCSFSLIL